MKKLGKIANGWVWGWWIRIGHWLGFHQVLIYAPDDEYIKAITWSNDSAYLDAIMDMYDKDDFDRLDK